MNIKTILVFVFVFLALVAGAFYWYEYRPSQIRAECNHLAESKGGASKYKEERYVSCLNSKGLVK